MSVQNVKQQPKGTQYGILIYDIPKENEALYYRIQTKIRQKAIRLNLSVYLLLWGMRGEIEKIIDEAQQETGQYASVFFAKFDNSEEEHILRAAKESLLAEMKRIAKRLVDNVKKAREKAEKEGKEFKHISEGYAYKIKHKLEEAEALAMLFGLTRDVKYAMESVQKSFAAELEKILAEKAQKKAAKKAEREAKKEAEKAAKKAERKRKKEEKQKFITDPITGGSKDGAEIPPDQELVQEESSVQMDDDVDTVEVEDEAPEHENMPGPCPNCGELPPDCECAAGEDDEDHVDVPDGDGNPSTSWTDPV
jgi:hypothetical protein